MLWKEEIRITPTPIPALQESYHNHRDPFAEGFFTTWHLGTLVRVNPLGTYNRSMKESQKVKGMRSPKEFSMAVLQSCSDKTLSREHTYSPRSPHKSRASLPASFGGLGFIGFSVLEDPPVGYWAVGKRMETRIMENQTEEKMDNDMKIVVLPRPSSYPLCGLSTHY